MEEHVTKPRRNSNPREGASIFSVLTFFYTLSTFFRKNNGDFTEDDLYKTYSKHKASALSQKAIHLWQCELENSEKMKTSPSLLKILIKLFCRDIVFVGLAVALEHLVIYPGTAVLLGELVSCYTNSEEYSHAYYLPYIYAISIIALLLLHCNVTQSYFMAGFHTGLKIRVVCSCLIYEKIFKLNKSTLNKFTPGHIINLLSTDVIAFDHISYYIQFIWIVPIQSILVLYLLYSEIGRSSLLGFGLLVMCVPVYVLFGKILQNYRLKVSIRRDDRLRATNELIKGIRVIKMYGWEKPFTNVVTKFRKMEIESIRKSSYLKRIYTFDDIIIVLSIFATITVFVLLNDVFETRSVFVIIRLCCMVGSTFANILPASISCLTEAKVSLQRIFNFLLCEEVGCQPQTALNDLAVTILNGFAKWDKNKNSDTLIKLNLEIKSGSITAIIGEVGSGKSSLCQVIQEELPLNNGEIIVTGSMSCAPQEAWIFSATIRQNILFGSDMNESRYESVIKCCSLKTDLLQFANGDQTVIGENGASLSGGQKARISLARCVYRKADIYIMDDPFSAVDSYVGKQIFENCIQTFLKGKTVILVTHQFQFLKQVDNILVVENGYVQPAGSTMDLEKLNFNFSKYLKQDKENLQDDILEETDKNEQKIIENEKEETNSGLISFSTYKNYLLASNKYLLFISLVFVFIMAEVAVRGSYYFIAYWVNVQQNRTSKSQASEENLYVYIYSTIAVSVIVLTTLRIIFFVNLTMASSKSLHDAMFLRLMHSNLNFFISNSSGRILNRFSKDLYSIDELLPNASITAILTILAASGILGVVCIVNVWFVIPTVLIIVLLFSIRKFYLNTNLSILRVESVVRSPIYAYVQATLQGLSTIRTFKMQTKLKEEFHGHLDVHSTALHMSCSISRAFGYWIDLLCFLFMSSITIFYVLSNETYGGNVGLVITQIMQMMAILPRGIRLLTEVENCMVSVERVLQYHNIQTERNLESPPHLRPSLSWPYSGKIQFKRVYLKYSLTEHYILKDLNFTIEPIQKIGIVGRTGAGKSSLISALFQLVETEGSIIIDEIDITKIGLHDLRKRISIIPQDPVLFSGTIRSNLDPFNEFEDECLWKAIEDVKLKQIIHGLDFFITHDGSNLSIGQRQLVCLARAIVRSNKILVLDEATANVDVTTEKIIQETIKTKFSECTVLTVAHRISTIIDCDKILVVSSGEVVEFDHPHTLLQNVDGFFYDMVQHTENADGLIHSAQESFEKMKNSL